MSLPPSITKRLRACLGCSLIMAQNQFKDEGCPNCSVLNLKDSTDNILDCTTDRYFGVIGMYNGKASWVGKWQHMDGYVPGLYAITMEGELPESKILALERAGRTYHPRNKSFTI
ncbi:transcription elongation factor SPT4 [Nematocida minor]|uniref:transcription elongation factor SPT4 n=1 Tax=Nematocida minor TaxID=1912983 RepID=UPI00221E7E1F|nr:transcription elongation factor SPT4 [Nematocida minor]KAI5192196.1 transcription elongation factor SPT4 [Nematocida minor]